MTEKANKTNIVLIGMPGAGKSTVGMLVARKNKMSFIDTDVLIRRQEKRPLQQIIAEQGLNSFLSIEEAVVLELSYQRHVVATGGSVIYSQASVDHLKLEGVLVYLKLTYNSIERRIKNMATRGIALRPGQSLLELYRERTPLYEKQADLIVDCSRKHIEAIVTEIIQKVDKWQSEN